MDREFVESLGWEYKYNWANRDFYKIGQYTIVEHNGDWCICVDDDLYFADIKFKHTLEEYTNLIKKRTEIENAPSNHTLQEYWDINNEIDDFYSKCKEIQDEEEPLDFSDLELDNIFGED